MKNSKDHTKTKIYVREIQRHNSNGPGVRNSKSSGPLVTCMKQKTYSEKTE